METEVNNKAEKNEQIHNSTIKTAVIEMNKHKHYCMGLPVALNELTFIIY